MDDDSIIAALKDLFSGIVRKEIREALADNDGNHQKLLMNTAEAAELLQLPESWVAAAARRGELASVRCGHHVRFRLTDLEQFINQRNSR